MENKTTDNVGPKDVIYEKVTNYCVPHTIHIQSSQKDVVWRDKKKNMLTK